MNGCLKAVLAGLVIILLLGLGAFKLFQNFSSSVDSFPDYAKRDVVYSQYGPLIERVQSAIEASESMYDLAARLEKIPVPDELLYLTLTKEGASFDDDKIEIVDKLDVRSSSYTLIGNTGYGRLNDLPVIVIELPVNRHSIEDCLIYLRRHPSGSAPERDEVEPAETAAMFAKLPISDDRYIGVEAVAG